jgi:hypothetical protein
MDKHKREYIDVPLQFLQWQADFILNIAAAKAIQPFWAKIKLQGMDWEHNASAKEEREARTIPSNRNKLRGP